MIKKRKECPNWLDSMVRLSAYGLEGLRFDPSQGHIAGLIPGPGQDTCGRQPINASKWRKHSFFLIQTSTDPPNHILHMSRFPNIQ